ncbi:MAG: type II secretion system protein [Planctomycetes bacterium]|nr:type II secretion system protein [Planctomycetota bacterium]
MSEIRCGSDISFKSEYRAFTIVELLVVISIITILAAILLPALKTAVSKARDLNCLNNQKQTGFGVQMYLGEESGYMPYKAGNAQDMKYDHGKGLLKKGCYIEDVRILWCGNESTPTRQSASRHHYSGMANFAKTPPPHNSETDVWYRYARTQDSIQDMPTEKISHISKPSRTGLFMCAGLGGNRILWSQLHDGRGFALSMVDGSQVWYDFQVCLPVSAWNTGSYYHCKKPINALNYAVGRYNDAH